MAVADRFFSLAALALAVLSIYIAHAELATASEGVFLVWPSATVFWGAYFGFGVGVVSYLWLDADPGRLALLSTVQILLAHDLLYGGALSFWEYAAPSTYVPALAAAIAAAAPGLARVHRGEKRHAAAVFGVVSVAIGVALCFIASCRARPGPSGPALAVFAGVWCIITGGVSGFAAFTVQPRAILMNKACWGMACIFVFLTAVLEGKKSHGLSRSAMVSVAAGLAMLNCVAGGGAAATLRPATAFLAPEEAATEAPVPPPKTRLMGLRKEVELAAIADEEQAVFKEG